VRVAGQLIRSTSVTQFEIDAGPGLNLLGPCAAKVQQMRVTEMDAVIKKMAGALARPVSASLPDT
jgi:hypothetical protein